MRSQGSVLIAAAGSASSVGRAVGVATRTVQSWRYGEHAPSARHRALIEVRYGIAAEAWQRPALEGRA